MIKRSTICILFYTDDFFLRFKTKLCTCVSTYGILRRIAKLEQKRFIVHIFAKHLLFVIKYRESNIIKYKNWDILLLCIYYINKIIAIVVVHDRIIVCNVYIIHINSCNSYKFKNFNFKAINCSNLKKLEVIVLKM